MFKVIVILCIVLPPILSQWVYNNYPDRMSDGDKHKVKNLAQELIVESKYKIKQTDPIRDEYAKMIGFQVGTLIGYIREKYKTMLEVYRQTSNKFNETAKIILSRVPYRRPIHFFMRMETISSLEVDIDRLVNILESIPNSSHGIHKYNRRVGSCDFDSSEMSNYRIELFKKLQLNPPSN